MRTLRFDGWGRRVIAAVLGWALGIGVSLPGFAWAGEKIDDTGIEINVTPLPTVEGGSGRNYGISHGYVEYRVQLKNDSERDQTVYLTYPGKRAEHGTVATRTVDVAHGQEVSVSLYQPCSEVVNDIMDVEVRGMREPHAVRVGNMRAYRYEGSICPAILTSRNVPRDFRDRVPKKEEPKPESGSAPPSPPPGRSPHSPAISTPESEPFTLVRSEVPISQWNTDWLAYSCYDAILITEQDAEEMPAQAQMAIRRYLECGGTLWVHGFTAPDVFLQGGTPDGKGGYYVGMGYVAATFDDQSTDWDGTCKRLVDSGIFVYQPVEKPGNLHDLLLAETSVPVRGLFVLVLLFALLIGPVNIILLSIYKRRIWLWWNVPVISLLTCLAVFGYALFSEGWTSRGEVATMTVLDERCHRATSLGHLSYYCPLTPSAGLHFSTDTDTARLETQPNWRRYVGRYSAGESGLRYVDWTNDQHLTTGWVTARVPAYFQIRKNEDRRERLSIEKKPDGSLAVVNALGANIQRLYFADASGRVFEATEVAKGAERTLTPTEQKAAGQGFAPLRQLFTSPDWLAKFVDLKDTKDYSALLVPGSYIAFLENNPFVESPIAGANSQDSVAIVYGISKGADDGR